MHSLLEVYVCRKLMDSDVAISLWQHRKKHHQKNDCHWEKDLHRKLMHSPFCLRTYYHYLAIVPGVSGIEARRIVLGLRNFIQFLTLHSWGNPKRMELLFTHFTKPIESVDWRRKDLVKNIRGPLNNAHVALQFGLLDQQRIVLASNLYTQLYHDLSRQLASSGDKLVVSTMAAFQYILKFHRYPFSRYHLERMSETLSVYHSPELNTMIDTLVSKVLHQHIRRIRNSHYRYRFNGDFEQELRYISRVSDGESAAFNFSLDAAAPIKAHYLEQLKDMNEKGASVGKNEVVIYELCTIIGDLLALEQSHDEALTYYQRAVDIFDQCSEERPVGLTHFYVEALLRLGEIYERRQRYDQAASVYLHANSAVNKLQTASTSAGHEGLDVLKRGDSKWDIFRQPFWAYWYLQLKRSPVPSRSKLPPVFEYPFGKDNDRVNHYRAGQLAFFYGCYDIATGSFLKAIQYSGIKTENTERATYLGAYAYLHLGSNLFVGMMSYLLERMPSEPVPQNLAELADHAQKFRDEIVKVCNNTIFNPLNSSPLSLDQLEDTFSADRESYLRKLSGITEKTTFLETVDVSKTLGMMTFAAKKLAERGLHYHASFAYLKILALWGMISEVLFVLTEVGNYGESRTAEDKEVPLQGSLAGRMLGNSEKWIAEVRKRADNSIAYLTMGGFGRFKARWASRDVEEFPFDKKCVNEINLLFKKNNMIQNVIDLKNDKKGDDIRLENVFDLQEGDDTSLELDKSLDILFPYYKNKSFSVNKQEIKRRRESMSEPIFLQCSIMGQKLIYLSIWEYMAKVRFRSKKEPLAIPHQNMVPHSTRSLMFSHWLTGRRYLLWQVLDKLPNLDSKLAEGWKEKYDAIYNFAAAAVHNLHRAIYYIRQLSGDDHDLMFPNPSMVLYDLWRLLYALVEWELKHSAGKTGFDATVASVGHELSTSRLRRRDTPANFYNFNNVTRQAVDALRVVEQLVDITNRVRSDAIKTRLFLADDYEDPRFHLDWTLVQMYGPTAGILRLYVESASKKLADQGLDPVAGLLKASLRSSSLP